MSACDKELKRIVREGAYIDTDDNGNPCIEVKDWFYDAWFNRRFAVALGSARPTECDEEENSNGT